MSGEPTKGEPRKECLIATGPRNLVATPTSADSASLARGRSRSSQKALPWFACSSYRYFINNRQPKGSLSNVLSG
jgi:hypothetical protein